MKKLGFIVAFLAVVFVFLGWKKDKNQIISVPKGWPKLAKDFQHKTLNRQVIQLGRRLFYDPILSRDSTISCSSCHLNYTAFSHTDHALSHGIDGKIGTRNAPALINLAWKDQFMRDGNIKHLHQQAIMPITNVLEMDLPMENALHRLNSSSIYRNLFSQAFGHNEILEQQVLESLTQFMLTLVSNQSKYDFVMQGIQTFTKQENKGFQLFKKYCNACHTAPLFTRNGFENNGLPFDTTLNDFGRFNVTNNNDDSFKFSIPTLRNIAYSFPYMHDGRFKTLTKVLQHYVSGVHQSTSTSSLVQKGLPLSANDRVDIISFLLTLTDTSFLRNPEFAFPKETLAH